MAGRHGRKQVGPAPRSGSFAVAALMAVAIACGGGNGGPMSPSPPVSGSPGPSGATIRIANGAVTPSTVRIAAGQSVTFVNNDNRSREMSSNPHPTHTDCPQLNAVGSIPAGATRSTNAFPAARDCGFHDHNDPDNRNLQGTIEIR